MTKKKAFTPLLYLASLVFFCPGGSLYHLIKVWNLGLLIGGNTKQFETFLNAIQEKIILEKLVELEELFFLDEMIKECPETHLQTLRMGIHKETI